MNEIAKVFIKINENNFVIDINSDKFIKDITDWVQIDEGITDRYIFAQDNYLDKPLTVQSNIYRYKYIDGIVSERTPAEIQTDINKIVVPLSETDLLKAQLKAQIERGEFMEDVIAEMAMRFY